MNYDDDYIILLYERYPYPIIYSRKKWEFYKQIFNLKSLEELKQHLLNTQINSGTTERIRNIFYIKDIML